MKSDPHPFADTHLRKRHRRARWFKNLTLFAIGLSISFLFYFLTDMVVKGLPAFQQTYIKVTIHYTTQSQSNPFAALDKSYRKIISRAWYRALPQQMAVNPALLNTQAEVWALADDQVDQYLKGHYHNLKPKERTLVDHLQAKGEVVLKFNALFFSHSDSKIPEFAGLKSAMVGSVLTLFITMVLAFPLGVMTAVYLEEFAIDNRWTQFIEININNLAAIPSILFGLLGLAIFINLFGLPRSSALVGGLTLALMTLPIIIVSARAALRSIPDSIRQAGYGLGLSKLQVVQDHVLPLAFPGILTGSIIGLAHAMGETAPLIIIGMIAFIPDSPDSFTQAATVMPAQIFTWAGMPERAYIEKTAAAIMVLLGVLLSFNGLAIYLRKKFAVKW